MSSSKEFPLEAVNFHGPSYLKHALTSCTDPLKAIEEFQVSYIQQLTMILYKCYYRLQMVFFYHHYAPCFLCWIYMGLED